MKTIKRFIELQASGWRQLVMFLIVGAVAIAARAIILPAIWDELPFYRTVHKGWDQQRNSDWARHIAGGDWLCMKWPGQKPVAFWDAPLYAYLLAGVYRIAGSGSPGGDMETIAASPLAPTEHQGNVAAGIVLNAMFGTAAALIAAGLAHRLFGFWAGLTAGLLMALNGSMISVEAMLLVNTVLVPMALGALWLIAYLYEATPGQSRWRVLLWLFPGVLLGVASTGRGTYLVVALGFCVLLAAPFISRRRLFSLVPSLLLALGVIVGAGPLVVRNGMVGGKWTLAAGGPLNLYIGNTPGAPGFYYFLPERQEAYRRLQESGSYTSLWTRELWPEIKKEPGEFVATLLRKTLLFFSSWDIPDNGNYYFVRRYVAPLRFLTFGPLFLWAAGMAGIILTARQWRQLIPLYAFGLLFSASIIIVLVSGRFKLPFLGLLAVFAGGGLAVVVEHARAGQWLVPAGAAVLGGVFTFLFWPRGPIWLDYKDVPLRPNEFFSNSKSLEEEGRGAEAARMIEDGGRLFQGDASFPLLLSRWDLQEHRPEMAAARIEMFLAKKPEITPTLEALFELQVAVYWKMGKRKEVVASALNLRNMFPENALAPRVLAEYGGGKP